MSPLSLLAFVLLSIGNAELWVAFVNRTHARPIRCEKLRHIRHLHDLMVLLFPLLLFGLAGFSGPRLLFGGDWTALPWWLFPYLLLCSIGALGFLWSVIQYGLQRPTPLLIKQTADIVDVAAELNEPPTGDGGMQYMLRVPFNQAFEIELNRKEFRHPRLPEQWEGLTLLHLSDWHFTGTPDRRYFERATELAASCNADIIIFSGDLIDRNDLLDWIPTTLGKLSAPLGCWYVLGNHDWNLDPDITREALAKHGWRDTAGTVTKILHKEKTLAIGGDETPWMGTPPDFIAAASMASATDNEHPQPVDFRLLIAHSPDRLEYARSQQVDLMLAGHTHGGQVVLPIIGPIYSPSHNGVKHCGGSFWEPPTLLHVSRGLNGRHPLRIRCRPELTAITLRTE